MRRALHCHDSGRQGRAPLHGLARAAARPGGALAMVASLGLLAGLLLAPELVRAAADDGPLELQEDDLLSQLRRRLALAPRGRLVRVRSDPGFVSGPYPGAGGGVWVGRRTGSGSEPSELVEVGPGGRALRIRALGGTVGAEPIWTTTGLQVAMEQSRWLVARGPGGGVVWQASRTFYRTLYLAPTPGGGVLVAPAGNQLFWVTWQGRVARTALLGGEPLGPPQVGRDSRVFLCLRSGRRLVALSADGRPLWRDDAARCTGSPTLTPDGGLLVPSVGRVRRYAADGKRLWEAELSGEPASPRLAADGSLVVATNRGLLASLSARGKLRWTFPLGKAGTYPGLAPSPAGGWLVTSDAGYLLSLGPRGKLRWWYPAPKVRPWVVPRHDGAAWAVGAEAGLWLVAPPGAPAATRPGLRRAP